MVFMEDAPQKERLEQELRFLKESFEADVISKEEFEKGKERIERKLREIESSNHNANPKEQIEEKKEEEEKQEYAKEEKEAVPQIKKKDKDIQAEEKTEEPIKKDEQRESRFYKYAIIFVVLLLAVFLIYNFVKGKNEGKNESTQNIEKITAACDTDANCIEEGKTGKCINPSTKEAKCEFTEVPLKVTVLNDRKGCFNCDTSRVLSILESWFGLIEATEIDYNSELGKDTALKYGASRLPFYIIDESVSKEEMFEKFKRAFSQKEGSYILGEDAAGSAFYLDRESIPNNLDFFIIDGDEASAKAEKNLREFLVNFKGIKYIKHDINSNLTKELNIRNFPAFLVNNKVRFNGVQSAESIKEKYCSLNKDDTCKKVLSKNLV